MRQQGWPANQPVSLLTSQLLGREVLGSERTCAFTAVERVQNSKFQQPIVLFDCLTGW